MPSQTRRSGAQKHQAGSRPSQVENHGSLNLLYGAVRGAQSPWGTAQGVYGPQGEECKGRGGSAGPRLSAARDMARLRPRACQDQVDCRWPEAALRKQESDRRAGTRGHPGAAAQQQVCPALGEKTETKGRPRAGPQSCPAEQLTPWAGPEGGLSLRRVPPGLPGCSRARHSLAVSEGTRGAAVHQPSCHQAGADPAQPHTSHPPGPFLRGAIPCRPGCPFLGQSSPCRARPRRRCRALADLCGCPRPPGSGRAASLTHPRDHFRILSGGSRFCKRRFQGAERGRASSPRKGQGGVPAPPKPVSPRTPQAGGAQTEV